MTGLKTGVTDEAGYCFTGSFALKSSVDGGAFEAVTVVMGTKSNDARWRTTKELVDLAAGTFSHVPLVDAAKPVKRYAIPSAEEESIVLYPAKSFSVFTYTNQNFDVRYKIDETIKAPLRPKQNTEKFPSIGTESSSRSLTLSPINPPERRDYGRA